ncbi:MAG: hypothetical protein JKX69_02585, partial [Rhodobacteraceae bacterium]|nr:hypothetical protein [Paracoccaceae bacterium]
KQRELSLARTALSGITSDTVSLEQTKSNLEQSVQKLHADVKNERETLLQIQEELSRMRAERAKFETDEAEMTALKAEIGEGTRQQGELTAQLAVIQASLDTAKIELFDAIRARELAQAAETYALILGNKKTLLEGDIQNLNGKAEQAESDLRALNDRIGTSQQELEAKRKEIAALMGELQQKSNELRRESGHLDTASNILSDLRAKKGPARVSPPAGVEVVRVETAREMQAAVSAGLPAACVVCAAAVADWHIVGASEQKIKKGKNGLPELHFAENPDILAGVAQMGAGRPQLVVGFAAETEKLLEHARAKRLRKGCDWILANDVSPETGIMGGTENDVVLITDEGEEDWPRMSKDAVARKPAARIAEALQ